MTDRFSEDDVVSTVTRLTRSQLVYFIEGAFVKPQRAPSGYVFRQIDIARLELLCDLTLELDLDETGLGIVTSLIDQLHTVRQDLATLAQAVDQQPEELRLRITAALNRP